MNIDLLLIMAFIVWLLLNIAVLRSSLQKGKEEFSNALIGVLFINLIIVLVGWAATLYGMQ